jgi:nitrile hydratase accessory protein
VGDQRAAAVLEWEGPTAPPRRNGELVFDTVWESRVFGMTMTLFEAGHFHWEEFRSRLIAAIAASEQHPSGEAYRYWDCWFDAFEHLVVDKGLCVPEALDARSAVLAARPHGHDLVKSAI